MVTDVVVLLDFISSRDAEDCVAARRELKAFHFNGILKSKCLATQKKGNRQIATKNNLSSS